MKLLIDTHTFLWFVNDEPQLSESAAALLESGATVFLSIASVWELAIKVSVGRLILPKPFDIFIPEQLALNAITVRPIRLADCYQVSRLPFHHRDPFDRLIIAQALVDGIDIISIDTAFDAYPIQRLW